MNGLERAWYSASVQGTAWIGSLNRTLLRTVEREPRGVTLTCGAGAEPVLRELVRLESTCCAFQTLRLASAPSDAITLRIQAPDMEGVEQLLAPLLTGSTEADR